MSNEADNCSTGLNATFSDVLGWNFKVRKILPELGL
jgi:hypothetical protein